MIPAITKTAIDQAVFMDRLIVETAPNILGRPDIIAYGVLWGINFAIESLADSCPDAAQYLRENVAVQG